jgi:hypothetical protein
MDSAYICFICRSGYITPHITNCSHVACAPCLVALVQSEQFSEGCPKCRQVISEIRPCYLDETGRSEVAGDVDVTQSVTFLKEWNAARNTFLNMSGDGAAPWLSEPITYYILKNMNQPPNWSSIPAAFRSERVLIEGLSAKLIRFGDVADHLETMSQTVIEYMLALRIMRFNQLPEKLRSERLADIAINSDVSEYTEISHDFLSAKTSALVFIRDYTVFEHIPFHKFSKEFLLALLVFAPSMLSLFEHVPPVASLNEPDIAFILKESTVQKLFECIPFRRRSLFLTEVFLMKTGSYINAIVHSVPRATRLALMTKYAPMFTSMSEREKMEANENISTAMQNFNIFCTYSVDTLEFIKCLNIFNELSLESGLSRNIFNSSMITTLSLNLPIFGSRFPARVRASPEESGEDLSDEDIDRMIDEYSPDTNSAMDENMEYNEMHDLNDENDDFLFSHDDILDPDAGEDYGAAE